MPKSKQKRKPKDTAQFTSYLSSKIKMSKCFRYKA